MNQPGHEPDLVEAAPSRSSLFQGHFLVARGCTGWCNFMWSVPYACNIVTDYWRGLTHAPCFPMSVRKQPFRSSDCHDVFRLRCPPESPRRQQKQFCRTTSMPENCCFSIATQSRRNWSTLQLTISADAAYCCPQLNSPCWTLTLTALMRSSSREGFRGLQHLSTQLGQEVWAQDVRRRTQLGRCPGWWQRWPQEPRDSG